MASDEKLAAYLAGGLDPETRDRLEEELLSDPESRAELLGQRRVSAGLYALLGNATSLEQAIVTTLRSAPQEVAVEQLLASDEKLAAYLAGGLDPETRDRLEEELLSDPESRAELLGQRRISAGLYALLGNATSLEQAIVTTLRSAPQEVAVEQLLASDEKLAAYLAGGLDPETRDGLEEELLSDPESRAELLGQRRISAGLHALLGNATSLEQAIVTTLRSAPEEAAIARIVKATVEQSRRPKAPRWAEHLSLGWVRQLAAVLVAAAFTAAVFQIPRRMQPVAFLRDVVAADWKSGDPGNVGANLKPGWLELKDGLAEVEFRSGTRVAVQGPARFRLIDSNSMELQSGKLSADVPHEATGFTVETSAGRVIDIGTKFGVNIRSEQLAEVHVLEGRVEVQHARGEERELSQGQAVAIQRAAEHGISQLSFAPEQFPRPSRSFAGLLVGGGFEEDTLVAIDYAPRQFNLWSGDPAFVVPESDGITPRSGRQMLRFELPEQGKPVADEQWQLVDLHPIREASQNAPSEATLSVWFNRGANATTRPSFGVTLAAFHGDPSQAPHFWAARREKALALAERTIRTDLDPKTWERAEAHITIPRDADFLLVQISANQDREPAIGDPGPSAHYADDATLEIRTGATTAQSEMVH